MREVDIQLSFALKQRAKCANVSNFSKALDVSKEMDDLRKKKRKYQEELTLLQRKEALSNRVKKCMSRRTKTPAPAKGNLDQFLCKKSASSEQAKASDSASISHEDVTEISQFNTSHDVTITTASQHTCNPNNQEAVTGQHDVTITTASQHTCNPNNQEAVPGQHDVTITTASQHTCNPNQEAVTGQHDASMSQDNMEQGEESMTGQHDSNECF